MLVRIFRRTILALAFAAPATAAYADARDWVGPYVGINLGYSFGASQSRTTTTFVRGGYFPTPADVAAIDGVGNQHLSPDGFVAGAQGGYNIAFDPNWVLGLELDFDANSISDKEAFSGTYPCCAPSSFTIGSKIDSSWLITLRPVLGYAWDNWMIYGTGGLALHDQKASFVFTDNLANAVATGGFSTTKGTYAVGGGFQGKIDANWSWRVEYLYLDYGHMGGTSHNLMAGTPAVAFPQNPFTQLASFTGNTVRFAVNYRF
jgi:outer membrane immunogenic protein